MSFNGMREEPWFRMLFHACRYTEHQTSNIDVQMCMSHQLFPFIPIFFWLYWLPQKRILLSVSRDFSKQCSHTKWMLHEKTMFKGHYMIDKSLAAECMDLSLLFFLITACQSKCTVSRIAWKGPELSFDLVQQPQQVSLGPVDWQESSFSMVGVSLISHFCWYVSRYLI